MNWNAKLKRVAAILLAVLLVMQVSPIDAEWGDSGSHAVYSDWWSPSFVQRTPEYTFSGVGDSVLLSYLLGINGIFGIIVDVAADSKMVSLSEDLHLTAVAYFDSVPLTVTTALRTHTIILHNPGQSIIVAGTEVTGANGSFTATGEIPAGTELVVGDFAPTEALLAAIPANDENSELVWMEIGLQAPDGESVQAGAEVAVHTQIALPEAPVVNGLAGRAVVKNAKLYHVIGDAEVEELPVEVETEDGAITALRFATASFSGFALSYTVDFEYTLNGQTYTFTLPGGGYVTLRQLAEALGLGTADGQTMEAFLAGVAGVTFSDPSLVWAGQAAEDTTVGQLKTANGLTCEYSAELTEEQIAEIDGAAVAAGEWLLISLKPFTSEETLTVTMKDGDVWTVKVTDAQQITDSANFKTSDRFVIAHVNAQGKCIVLTSDGSWEMFDTIEDIDFLDSRYLWRFYYVFTEKNQEAHNANYEYYFIRPIEDLSKSIALIDAHDTELIQSGANNIAVIPQGNGTYVMEGYSSVGDPMPCLYFDGEKFLPHDTNQTPLTIFKQDSIPEHQFTVRTADPAMGLVYGKDKDGNEQNGVVQFVTRTKDSGNNHWAAEAKANDESAGGQYRYLFDYFDLNGEVVPANKVTVTNNGRNARIGADQLEIPYNGSILTAHFKQNPNYVGASRVESLQEWVNEIKNTNVPLDEAATKKTAEVYDYENRIYRVDITTRSSLSSFTGTVDLGLILDVSGSMKFPSKLVPAQNSSGAVIGTKNVRSINEATARDRWGNPTRYAWQDWGLSPSEEYYVIAEKNTRATVFRLFYENGKWWRVDASYTNNEVDDKGRRKAEEINNQTTKPTKFGEDTDFNYPIYASADNYSDGTPITRSYYEKKSIDDTASTLNEVLGILNISSETSEAPNVRAAWNTFCYEIKDHSPDVDGKHSFISLKDNSTLNIDYATAGGTRTELAVEDALEFDWGSSNTKYAIIITDGAPQYGGNQHPDDLGRDLERETERLVNATKAQIASLKAQGVKVITVGLSMKDVEQGTQLLYDIADTVNGKHMFFQAESGDELQNVMLEIVKTILLPCHVYGDVTDTVSEAFYLVDRATGKPLKAGDHISLTGDLTNDLSGAYGTVQSDGRTVKWENQDFSPEGWQGTVYVKAKEDLLGGNMLPTNSGNAVIETKQYSTKANPDHRINITTNTSQIVNPAKFHPVLERETPLVNVNELSFTHNSTEWTVYLGTEVDPKEQLKALWREILVEEVLNKGTASDMDGNGLPEIGNASTSTPWYPISENSIVDDRESQGNGDQETFSMNNLIKVLAQGKSYSWWDYSKNEPNWDVFFYQALKGGITIPYHLYGIADKSKIVISLEKTIVEGEKDYTDSPHHTAVTGDGVEQYTLTVNYSPDYTVLPRGQGGSRSGDIHTGIYGTLYQGHAAGTETSENTHVINVYAIPLEIEKLDETDNEPLSGAEFKLYKVDETNGQTVAGLDSAHRYAEVAATTSWTNGVSRLLKQDGNDFELVLGEKYYLIETAAPPYYAKTNKVWEVTVETGNERYTPLVGTAATSGQTNVPVSTGTRPSYPFNWDQDARILVNDPPIAVVKRGAAGTAEISTGEDFVTHTDVISFRYTVRNTPLTADVDIQIKKILRGRDMAAGEFAFVLQPIDVKGNRDDNAKEIIYNPAGNADEEVQFDFTLHYTSEDLETALYHDRENQAIFFYVVHEEPGIATDIVYSKLQYIVKVTLSLNEDGTAIETEKKFYQYDGTSPLPGDALEGLTTQVNA